MCFILWIFYLYLFLWNTKDDILKNVILEISGLQICLVTNILQNILFLCSAEERKSYRFGMTVILGWFPYGYIFLLTLQSCPLSIYNWITNLTKCISSSLCLLLITDIVDILSQHRCSYRRDWYPTRNAFSLIIAFIWGQLKHYFSNKSAFS